MKERELRQHAACGVCGQKIGKAPVFYMVSVEHFVFDRAAIQRQTGLEMMMGGNTALAQAFSPDDDLAQRLEEPRRFSVCLSCATSPDVPAALVLSGGRA